MGLIAGNLLSLNLQSNEDAATSWQNNSNATMANSGTKFLDGLQSVRCTSTATADTKFQSPLIPIQPNARIYAEYWALTAVTARSSQFFFDLYSNGTYRTTPISAPVTDNTTTWTKNTYPGDTGLISGTGFRDLTHIQFGVLITGTVAAEVHYFDQMYMQDLNTGWSTLIHLLLTGR